MNILQSLLITIVGITTCFSASEILQSANSYLTTADKVHFKKILEPGLTSNDPASVYYAVLGYSFLGETLPNKREICDFLTEAANDESNITIEKGFYIASTWRALQNCPTTLNPSNIAKVFNSALEKDTMGMTELYHVVSGLTALSEKLARDKVDKITKTIQNAMQDDISLWNLGYAFHIASDLGTSGAFMFEQVEGTIAQADQVDGKYLQFEGGLSVSSHLINGIFKLSSALKKKIPLTSQNLVKFCNYFVSRRSVQTPRGATSLLSAITTLANNESEKPICITLPTEGISISSQQPLVTVKVCDVLGNPLTETLKVIANSATRVGDNVSISSKLSFQPSPTDKTLFTTNFMEAKPERGFYSISVTAGSVTNIVVVKVVSEVVVDHMEVGTADADQTTQPKLTRVTYPNSFSQKIEADSQQKVVMRFLLKDRATKKAIRTHQAFVRLSSASASKSDKKAQREIIFVAEPDSSHLYKFDMPVGTAASNFDFQSGDYNVELIIGDALLTNPFQWIMATVSLKFPEATWTERADKSVLYKYNVYTTKPEIKHMFREPEKRPPVFVSNLFTGLCLAPVLLLLILWARLGVNISNFPFSISAITFHLGLGSIFVLFGIFWLKLNMFVTLRYLLGLGVVTFLAGNKMLSHIAQKNKSR